MKTTVIRAFACLASLLPAPQAANAGDLPSSTAFTYQGRLEDGGNPADGNYAFLVRLFNGPGDAEQIGGDFCAGVVPVVHGLFTLSLDFGPIFPVDTPRYLEIRVLEDGDCSDTTEFIRLFPRQFITTTPRALHALKADVAVQAESAGLAEQADFADLSNAAHRLDAPDGSPTSAVFVDNNGNVGIGITGPGSPLHIRAPNAGALPGEGLRIQGTLTNLANQAYASFHNGLGTAVGYVGDGSTGDNNVFLASYLADVSLVTPAGRLLNATAGGNVGIGTTMPTAKLDVRGDVKLGPSGQFFATAGEEKLRIVRGRVSSAGAKLSGSGFTSARVGTGDYTITFDPPFAATPVVTANAEWITAQLNLTSTGMALVQGNNASTASIVMVSRWDGAELVNRGFHFIAVGPR